LGTWLKQIYLQQPYLPPRVNAPLDFEDRAALEVALSAQRGGTVTIAVPQRGAKKEMLALAARNAQLSFARRFPAATAAGEGYAGAPAQRDGHVWRELAEALALPLGDTPGRIEGFDISHFQGAETVASMVVWEAGAMRHAEYRRYRIRTVAGVDDFRSMAEVVRRRYERRLAEGAELPNLVLIDGGIGQLHAAQRVLTDLGLQDLPLASLAKREELVYLPGRETEPLRLSAESPALTGAGPRSAAPSDPLALAGAGGPRPQPYLRALHTLQAIRDEAHRFAITFHRERRGKANLRSELLAIPGVGPAAVRKLLQTFGSLSAVRSASLEALAAVLPSPRARAVWTSLHTPSAPPTNSPTN
ncbi:MAG: helix-hairpin-helix domain-containing protein, partial [Terriglobales bacterium]